MKRILLFCGFAWVIARFAFLYFLLYTGMNTPDPISGRSLLFAFGSAHAVMATAFFIAGACVIYIPVLARLLLVGQLMALFSDIVVLAGAFRAADTVYSFFSLTYAGFSSMFFFFAIAVVDVVFFLGLFFLVRSIGMKNNSPVDGSEDILLPEVREISVDEEE